MIIECDRCYARYRYDEARFEGKASKKVRCTKCLAIFDIFNAEAPPAPAPGESLAEDTVLRLAGEGDEADPAPSTPKNAAIARPGGATLRMPAESRVSVAVIAGPDSGRIHAIEKPRVVIGRHDADVNVEDPEISRHHAAIELTGDTVTLVDLGSTNGTFVGEERIREVVLENQAEFSIGGSTLMLIVTERGSRESGG
ncbi:MAG: zinc-ribbon domain-containing protein [Acidobacteriota bacterium]|nr:zinc-ribbon domain-containing protein [Acidobacteriota bacterium]